MNNLKPCPFCGGEPIILEEDCGGECFYSVECANCKAAFGIDFIEEDFAIEAWNRRVGEPGD